MNRRNIKFLIAIFSVLIIILILVILILKISSGNIEESNSEWNKGEPGDDIDYSTTVAEKVTDKISYYTVVNCINDYLGYLNNQSSAFYIGEELDQEMQREYIYNILDKDYIVHNNITNDNVLEKLRTYEEKPIFIPLEMRVLEKENLKSFIAYGIVQNVDNVYMEEIYIKVNLDFANKTYSIEPIEYRVNDIEDIEITNNNISINENSYNEYIQQKITNQYVVEQYMNLVKKVAITKPKYIYSKMPKEYKEKRYGSLEEFEKYIIDNKEEILKIKLKEYLVNNYDNYTEYVGKDKYGNLYIFNDYIDDFEIKLDTYTLENKEFTEEYNKAEDAKKVQMNIDKFIQMLNRQDYRTSYNYISEGFKNNYFGTQEDFENYAKEKFFTYNKLEFVKMEQKGDSVYVTKIRLTNMDSEDEENAEIKELNIIMQLNEDLDFEIAFEM